MKQNVGFLTHPDERRVPVLPALGEPERGFIYIHLNYCIVTFEFNGNSRDEPPTSTSRGPAALTHLFSAEDQYSSRLSGTCMLTACD